MKRHYSYPFSQGALSAIGGILLIIGIVVAYVAFVTANGPLAPFDGSNVVFALVGFLVFFLLALPLFAFAAIIKRLTDIANEVASLPRHLPEPEVQRREPLVAKREE